MVNIEDNRKFIVDSSGTILEEIEDNENYIKIERGDRVLKGNTISYLKSKAINYPFVKVNSILFGKYAKKYPILNSLIQYIGYMDNVITYTNGKKVKLKDLPKICEVSSSTIKRQLDGLVKDDIIHKIKNGKNRNLMINPYVAMVGKKVYLETYKEFESSELRYEVEMMVKNGK